MPTQLYFWWLSVLISLIIFGRMIAKLPDFIKERKAQKIEDEKLVETQAAKMARFNAALENEGEMAKMYGPNSPELLEAKKVCMELWKEVIGGE